MTAVAKKPDARRGLIGKIHVAKSQLGLDTDTYRAMLERVTGKTSAADCSLSQLEAMKAAMVDAGFKPKKRAHPRAGKRPLADGETAAKLRALWISGYHLGVVKDPSEGALSAFVKRATGGKARGVDAMQWMSAADARKAIEALKAWLGREAAVDWDSRAEPRRAVVEAQFRLLQDRAPGAPSDAYDLDRFLYMRGFEPILSLYSASDFDELIDALGELVRARKAKGGA